MDDVVCVPHATSTPDTLVRLLQMRADSQPDLKIYTFLEDGETQARPMTAVTLHHRAQAIAAHLQQINASGNRALLLYPPGLAYIAGFFGCLYANVTAVPAYPPDPARLNRTLPRLQAIIKDSQAQFVLTTAPILSMAEMLFAQAPDLRDLQWIASDAIPDETGAKWRDPNVTANTLAFLQYTSGSTGAPKGVMLQHRHLLANSAAIARAFGITPADSGVIWLPPYHDMGLIGGILQPIYCGSHCVLMSPLAFLQKPLRWLQAISDYQATVSGGPNFAYDLCVRKVTPEERDKLDLHSWRLAFSGAEPVRPQTLARFSETFAPSGFQSKAFYPSYGLAEATLLVASKAAPGDPVTCTVQKEALAQNKVVLAAGSDGQPLVSCGPSIPNQKIAIVNPETGTAVSPNEIGEIWVQGECVAAGYWNQPDLTARIFQAHLSDGDGPYLRTGDLGFLHDGELFIAGRAKDLIIIRGRNLYPQDVELTVETAHPALRPGCGAAFSIEADGEERLVMVQEVYTNRPFEADELVQTIRQAVAQTHEVQVYAVVLAQPRSVPKTSSGKIQRSACRQMYLDGELPLVVEDVLAVTAVSSPHTTAPPEPLLVKALRAMEPTTRQALILSHLQELVARTAGLAPEQLDPARPLTAIGLDSALSIELAHEIETAFGVTLRMENLLQETSLNDLAAHIDAQLMTPQREGTAVTAPPPPQTTTAPLSHGQRALWFLHQLDPHNPAYNVAHALRVRSPLDVAAFKRAFRQLIRRHPALRATFPVENGEPVQKIHPMLEPDFIMEDGRTWNEAQLRQRLAQEIYRPFDLANGPLMRVLIVSRAPDDHLLLLSMHHIITDLWSLAIMMVELGQFYREEMGQGAAKLKPLRTDYADYLRRQNETLNGPAGDKLRAFWLEKLSGDLPVLNLPTDRPRPAAPLYRGAAQSMRLGPELTAQLKELARTHNATPFMTLLTAFNVLMRKYTGQDDVIIGSPKANRTRQAARLLGYLVNPIPLRNDLSGNPTFAALLDQVRQNTLDAFAHGEYPFPLLVEELQPARDPNVPPIFQVMFAWQKTTRMVNNNDLAAFALGEKGQGMEIGTLQLESLHLEERPSPFDLTLLMAEAGDDLIATFEYSVDLFDAATIERMLGHFRALLTAVAAHPNQPIAQFDILTPAEQQKILVEWNDTHAPYPADQCTYQLFEAQVRETPEAVALRWNGRTLTYAQLNRRANQLAHYLQKQGVGPEAIVAISVRRSPEMVIGLLGIQKAGGAYLPLDPAYPSERLAFMLADAQPALLLLDGRAAATVTPPNGLKTVRLDEDWQHIAQERGENPATAVTPDNLAYVIYTSGSTGQPKGVLLAHRGLTNLVTAQTVIFDITSRDRILQFASFSFDASVSEIFMALTRGAALHLAPQEQLAAIPELHKLLREEKVTAVTLPPSVLALLPTDDLEHLQTVISAGEVCPPAVAARWATGRRFFNAYGPTEATVGPLCCRVQDLPAAANVPIGRPIPNIQTYILDKDGRPAPIGVPGELHLAGVGLARGYLNRPELTAEKFSVFSFQFSVDDPLNTENRTLKTENCTLKTIYRTGDLARYRPDGNIEYLGRLDHQVKIRGFRVEPGEIEAVLTRHTAVRDALVLDREISPENRQLVAYVIPANGAVSAGDLRRYLSRSLPDYMIPGHFIPLDDLPRTANGKINRRALPLPTGDRPELETRYVKPRNDLERRIAAAWQAALGLEKVGIYDNFFDLGGHSLLLVKVHALLQDAIQTDLPMVELFRYPTINALAEYLNNGSQKAVLQKSLIQGRKQRKVIKKRQQMLKNVMQKRHKKRRKKLW